MMMPVFPAVLWLIAACFLICLLLVIFGYHLYQRSRLAALAQDASGVASLAARKERLEAEIAEGRDRLAAQRKELERLDGDRRNQELLRADLANIERAIENRKREGESGLKFAADLDARIVRKRHLLARLEAEIKSLEETRKELEPLEKSAQELRFEIEQGKIRTALLAEQELKTATLQQEAYSLERRLEDLRIQIDPLQQEKDRLRQYIQQARHAASIKNEQILEQNAQLRNLEESVADLKKEHEDRAGKLEALKKEEAEAEIYLEDLNKRHDDLMERKRADLDSMQARIDGLVEKVDAEQQELRMMQARNEDERLAYERMEARRAALEIEIAKMAIAASTEEKSARKRRKKMRLARRPGKLTPKISEKAKTSQIFCEDAAQDRSGA